MPNVNALVYAWKGGHESNIGYGAGPGHGRHLDAFQSWKTARAFALSTPASCLPKNETAFKNMGRRLGRRFCEISNTIAAEQGSSKKAALTRVENLSGIGSWRRKPTPRPPADDI